MQARKLLTAALFALTFATAGARAQDYKDPYNTADNGKPMAPAKALDAMLGLYEYQLMGVAQAMPADKYDFAPAPGTFAPGSPAKYATVLTFAGEAKHLIGANYLFYSKVSGAAMPAAAKEASKLQTKDEILAALKQSFVYAHAQIATLTAQNAFNGIEGADGFHTPATLAAFAVAHGYDHYGQMVEYLRMNGIVPPGSK